MKLKIVSKEPIGRHKITFNKYYLEGEGFTVTYKNEDGELFDTRYILPDRWYYRNRSKMKPENNQ